MLSYSVILQMLPVRSCSIQQISLYDFDTLGIFTPKRQKIIVVQCIILQVQLHL